MTRQVKSRAVVLRLMLLAAVAGSCTASPHPRPQTYYITGAAPQAAPGVVLLQPALQPALHPAIQPVLHPFPALSPAHLLVRADEKPTEAGGGESTEKPSEGEEGWSSWLTGWLPSLPSGIGGGGASTETPKPEYTTEKATEKPTEATEKPYEGGAGAPAGAPTRLEELEPAGPAQPAQPALPALPALPPRPAQGAEQRYIPGQPQFYGNYAGLKRLGVQNLGNKGALPNFVLVRGAGEGAGAGVGVGVGAGPAPGTGYSHLGGKPEPEKLQAPVVPGTAALAFRNDLLRQRFADNHVAGVRAEKPGEPGEPDESEGVDAGEAAGPSVAQVKPQAIALAGPGGVAAAAPVGTALVGPGGLAVAAPAATAVAGPAGGGPPLVVPAASSRVLAAYFKQPAAAHLQQQQQQPYQQQVHLQRYQRGALPAVVALEQ